MAGKDKKKKKLTKAEKEKLKKEEAERKAQAEEESRLKAEQEEREREEREKQEREQRTLLEEQERVRHQAEIDELNEQLEDNTQYLTNLRKTIHEKNKWNRYMLCDGRPDPANKKDINTFITLMQEDHTELDIEKMLKNCELILELIDELWQIINDDIKEPDGNLIQNYKETIDDLQRLILLKIDESVLNILKTPNEKIDHDTLNIQHVQESKSIKLCLWGNAAKNPRVKQIVFGKESFAMELPKQMAMADIAVRVLFTKFDFLSPLCSTYEYKPPKVILTSSSEEDAKISEEKNDDELKEECPKEVSSRAPSTKTMLSVQEGTRNNKSRISISSVTSNDKDAPEGCTDQLSLVEEDTGTNENQELLETLNEEDNLEEGVIDLRTFAPLGPLVFVELVKLPPQARETNGWIMQEVAFDVLEIIPYGDDIDIQNSSVALHQSSMSSISNSAKQETPSIGYNLPIAFSMQLNEHVVIYDSPQLARWDEASKHWRTDGINDFRYEKDDEMVFFRTVHFGPFSIMQDVYCNMPFQSWQLRPTELNECVFNICGAETEVDILIKEGKCCVKFPNEMKKVEHICGIWMTPEQLIKVLRSVGINLFPYEDGETYVSILKKLESLTSSLYKHIALSASAFSYAWSKWNNECGEEKVVVQATEWIKSEFPLEDSYDLYMVSTRISCKLKMIEYCEEFSTDVYPESQMHPDLYHMLRDGASSKALQRLKNTSVVFIDCVHQLLTAANVLVYS